MWKHYLGDLSGEVSPYAAPMHAQDFSGLPQAYIVTAESDPLKDEILPLYRDILLVCEEEDLLGGTFFALDGCKLSSNASKECSGKVRIPNH